MPGVGVGSFRLSGGWAGGGLGELCGGGRWHGMASGWLGGNSGRCVCGGEAVCLLQTFSVAGMEVCVCGVNGFSRPHSPHVVTSRVVVSSSVAGSVVLMVLAVAVVLVV